MIVAPSLNVTMLSVETPATVAENVTGAFKHAGLALEVGCVICAFSAVLDKDNKMKAKKDMNLQEKIFLISLERTE